MTKRNNNKTVFLNTSIQKNDNRNHINGPPKFKNKKSEGSKATLSNKNPLAFNGEIAKRNSLLKGQQTRNPQGTIGGAIKYWRGQKILPDDNTPAAPLQLPNHWEEKIENSKLPKELINKITIAVATYELDIYRKIGKPVKSSDKFSEIKTYFNKSAANSALSALMYINYFNHTLMTKSQVAWQLGISRNATSEKMDYCFKHGYMVKHGTKYGSSDVFIEAYLDFSIRLAIRLNQTFANFSSMINVWNQDNDNK
tara:strand:- start:2746 stop:3507 length:762 start_codon:yes stop_codon:yes gene_type:complete